MQCPKCGSSEYLSSTVSAVNDKKGNAVLITTFKCAKPLFEIADKKGNPEVDAQGHPVAIVDADGKPTYCGEEWQA